MKAITSFSVQDGSAEIVIDDCFTPAVTCKQRRTPFADTAPSVGCCVACSLHWPDLVNVGGIGLYSRACIRTSNLAFHILVRELQVREPSHTGLRSYKGTDFTVHMVVRAGSSSHAPARKQVLM
jgi:hypothetical protein